MKAQAQASKFTVFKNSNRLSAVLNDHWSLTPLRHSRFIKYAGDMIKCNADAVQNLWSHLRCRARELS